MARRRRAKRPVRAGDALEGRHLPRAHRNRCYAPSPLPVGPIESRKATIPPAASSKIVAFTPTLAYRVNDDLSLAAGLDYYAHREAKLNGQLAKIDGDGDALGWNVSLLYRRDAWSLGASFHSGVHR